MPKMIEKIDWEELKNSLKKKRSGSLKNILQLANNFSLGDWADGLRTRILEFTGKF